MEKRNNKFIQGLIIGSLILIIALFTGINIQKNLDTPDNCGTCHEMKSFVLSFHEPANGSVIRKHDLDCLECHTNNSLKEARSALFEEMRVYTLKKITGVDLKMDLSALSVNCKRCHIVDNVQHFNVNDNTRCSECHWAHKPAEKKDNTNDGSNASIIPYGPHKNQSCQNCHGTAFQIPGCTKCHEGHYKTKPENSLCLECHLDPHVPLIPGISAKNRVRFSKNIPFFACQPCHEKQFYELTNTFTLHTEMNTCALCHTFHGEIPKCTYCHQTMKVQKHLELECKNCHRSNNYPECKACHGVSHEWSGFSASANPSN